MIKILFDIIISLRYIIEYIRILGDKNQKDYVFIRNADVIKMKNIKSKTAFISICSNTALVILKIIVGYATLSISIISEAVHSFLDLIAAIIAFFSVRESEKPPDTAHKFGHGKFENLSGFLEGILVFFVSIWIIYSAVNKIISKSFELENLGVGIAVMLISTIANFFVSRRLYKVAKETDSIALLGDAIHLSADVYTSLGVFIGLILIRITDLHILDPILAIFIAVIIIKAAYNLTKNSISGLVDVGLPEEEEIIIKKIISEHYSEFVEFHKLRTRKAGNERHIDLHLVMEKSKTLNDAHKFCDHLEEDIKKELPNSMVVIHLEPDKS